MKTKLLSSILTLVLAAILSPMTLNAQDIAKSKDHPVLNRYPDSRIADYESNFNAVEFATGSIDGNPQRESFEGDATIIRYFYKDADSQPSPLQLIRNYQNAIKKIGGEVIYERMPKDSDGGETTLKVKTGGKIIWVKVEPEIFSSPTQSYKLSIVELADMVQAVTANQLLEEIKDKGFATLHINFDTNKWELKDDGKAAVAEVANMLKASPELNISIQGHTDNVGNPADNKLLSQNRAKSVLEALVAAGINASRLSSDGFGEERPVADNRSDAGKAKNRRVELVKK